MSETNFDSTQITPVPPTTPKNFQRKSFTPNTATVPNTPSIPSTPNVLHTPNPQTPTNPAPLPSSKEPNKSKPPKPGFRYMKRSKRTALSEQNSSSMDSFEFEASTQDKTPSTVSSNFASFPAPSRPPVATNKSTPTQPTTDSKVNIIVPGADATYIPSARVSRVSSRSSFVSDDLDKYMSHTKQAHQPVPQPPPPSVQPRTTPTRQIITRAFSGKSLDTALQQDTPYEMAPPAIKV
jgi:hypothetical protein